MASRTHRALWIAAFIVGVISCASAADPLRLEVDQVFNGQTVMQGVVPVYADLENSGPDTHGVLRVTSEGGDVDYPVDLPRGAHKRLITYPNVYYGQIHFSLDTDKGHVERDLPLRGANEQGNSVLLISDTSGELAFIRSAAPKNESSDTPDRNQAVHLLDCYSKPGLGPTRPVGYSGISAIILGAGAERLSDEEVQAIKLWVLTGGTLVFVGGVSSPILADRRWTDMLPARDFHGAELSHSPKLSKLGGEEAHDLSVTTGTLVKGATGVRERSILVWAELPRGLGKTVFLSFNPFEAPLNKWLGRRQMLEKFLGTTEGVITGMFLTNFAANQGVQGFPGGSTYYSVRTTASSTGTTTYTYTTKSGGTTSTITSSVPLVAPAFSAPLSIRDDPFSMTLPSTGRIFFILLGYFIVVVPINFLVLKKLKRGELAWFTAPVVSLAFAGILFQSASSLYGAKMSTVTKGVIVGQEGNPEGVFIGNTEMFIPHGGSYDLKLSGVDTLGAVSNQQGFGGYSEDEDDREMGPIDLGEIKVPALQANNLSFKRITYRQRVPISEWLHISLESNEDNTARCEVANTGPYTLRSSEIVFGKTKEPIGELAPGQRKVVNISFKIANAPADSNTQDLTMFTAHKDRAALTGTLDGFRPGPQLGTDVPGRSAVKVALFSEWKGGRH